LSSRGWRELGATYADLAQALWSEIAELADESVRKEMLKRVSQRIGQQYASELIADSSSPEESVTDRMSGLVSVLADRKIPSRVDQSGELPVLEVQACPYPDMAIGESDRSVCELETDMLTKALGQEMELSQCRLDGHNCCQFRPTDEGKTK
jgi:predicted ArsR family transcriptional regulator